MNLAAIDVGSNAARLLIVEASVYHDGTVDYTKLNLLRIPLRLGFDVFGTGRISPQREKLLLDTMKVYKSLMEIYDVEGVKAAATSAMRDAQNGAELLEKVRAQTGINLRIISGDEEAAVLYETHAAETLSNRKSYLYIDVGGGSTEVTLFAHGELVAKKSFNIGTIRLLQGAVTTAQWNTMKDFLKKITKGHHPVKAIGTGGNINKIFSVSKRKEGRPLPFSFLKEYHEELSDLTPEERQHRYGFRADRADVIVPAMEIYLSVMKWVEADEIYVPKIGLADGLVKMLYAEKMREKEAVVE